MTLLTSQEFPAQSMSVRTDNCLNQMFKVSPLLDGYICAVHRTTSSLLCQ